MLFFRKDYASAKILIVQYIKTEAPCTVRQVSVW